MARRPDQRAAVQRSRRAPGRAVRPGHDPQPGALLPPFRPHRAAQRTTRGPDRAAGHTCHQPYRKDPAELAERLQYQQTVEPFLRVSATLEVVTTVPVAHVADIVLDHVL